MTGHPYRQPLADWRALEGFRCPPHALAEDAAFASYAKRIARVRETRYAKDGWFGFFERMHALRPFEDVLMDVYDNEREINRLADMLVEYELEELRLMCAAGVDAVQFGGRFRHGAAMLFSPEVWRSFFKAPRYRRLVNSPENREKPCFSIPAGTRRPFWRTCGIGVNAVWPQLTAYDMEELAARLRRLGLPARYVDRANDDARHGGCDARRACGGKGV